MGTNEHEYWEDGILTKSGGASYAEVTSVNGRDSCVPFFHMNHTFELGVVQAIQFPFSIRAYSCPFVVNISFNVALFANFPVLQTSSQRDVPQGEEGCLRNR